MANVAADFCASSALDLNVLILCRNLFSHSYKALKYYDLSYCPVTKKAVPKLC